MLTLTPPCGLLPEQQGPEVLVNVVLRSDSSGAIIDATLVGILPPGLVLSTTGGGQQVWVTAQTVRAGVGREYTNDPRSITKHVKSCLIWQLNQWQMTYGK